LLHGLSVCRGKNGSSTPGKPLAAFGRTDSALQLHEVFSGYNGWYALFFYETITAQNPQLA
jgi:hypothetical protein